MAYIVYDFLDLPVMLLNMDFLFSIKIKVHKCLICDIIIVEAVLIIFAVHCRDAASISLSVF